jgi:hypothetical protein
MPRTSPIYVPIVGQDELSKKLKSIQDRVGKFAGGMKALGSKLTRNVTLPLGIAGLASMKFARDLNESMANVGTLIPGERTKLEGYKKEVMALSAATGKANTDISEGLYQVISAYGDADDTIEKLNVTVKAGVAGRASTVESLNLLSAVTKVYGTETAKGMKETSDLAFLAVKMGQTTFPEMAAAIGRVTAYAETFNTSQVELFGTMATLTGVTGNAAEAATQMRAVYGALLKPSKELTKGAKQLGFESAVAMGKQLGLQKTLMAIELISMKPKEKKKALEEIGFSSFMAAKKSLGLANAIKGVSGAGETNIEMIGKLLGRKEAQVQAFALLGGQAKKYSKNLIGMTANTDATGEALKEQMEGINKSGADWKKFTAQLINFSVKIGDKLLPIMEKLLSKHIVPLLSKLEKMDPATLEWGIKLAGIAMALGPVLSVTGSFIGNLGNIMGLLTKTKAGTMALSKSFDIMTGTAQGTLGVLGKLGTALGAVGAVAAAGTAGYALGTVISKTFLEPHAEEKAKAREDLDNLRRKALEVARYGTREEKMAALVQLRAESIKNAPRAIESFEDAVGTVTSVFTDTESPMERMKRRTQELVDAQKKLIDSINEETRRIKTGTPAVAGTAATIAETRSVSKEIVEVRFPNKPEDVEVRRTGKKATNLRTGVVLAESF